MFTRLLYVHSLLCFCLTFALADDKPECPCGPDCKCPAGKCPGDCAIEVTVKDMGDHDRVTAKVFGKERVWDTKPGERASVSLCQTLVKGAMCGEGKCPLKMPNVNLVVNGVKSGGKKKVD
jgi:hypothetical protein